MTILDKRKFKDKEILLIQLAPIYSEVRMYIYTGKKKLQGLVHEGKPVMDLKFKSFSDAREAKMFFKYAVKKKGNLDWKKKI